MGAAGGNAVMESFLALAQNKFPTRQSWVAREELGSVTIVQTQKNEHRKPRRAAFGHLAPIKFETVMATFVALAPQVSCCQDFHQTLLV